MRWILVILVCSAIAAGCGTPAHTAGTRFTTSIAHRSLRSAVQLQARLFMRRFAAGDFGAEWAQLSQKAKSGWPSRSARTNMLQRKFPKGLVQASRVGAPVRGGPWVGPLGPGEIVTDGWRVPVTVTLERRPSLRPSGVGDLYRRLDLYLSAAPASKRVTIDGEGPASVDAPIIDPARLPSVHVRVPILMYHRIGPYPAPAQWTNTYGYQIEYGLTVPASQFGGEMRYLSSHGYHAISLPRLADALLYRLPLPSHPIVLTFDDGRQSPWFHAVPMLRRYGYTATFFVCSGFVGQTNQTANHLNVQRYLTWKQVMRLAGSGFWIEDHGQKDINALWGLPMPALRTEVQQSARLLAAHTHRPIQFIAYTGALWPYPAASETGPLERALFAHLARFGYAGAAVDARIPSSNESSAQLFQLPRVRVTPGEDVASFARSIRG